MPRQFLLVRFRRSFGPHKCCHPQISDLGVIISWWQLSCEIFLQILTSLELHSNSANGPRILLSHDGTLEVNLLMMFLELSLKISSRMTKSDIWGWQHLRVPKYLLDQIGLDFDQTRAKKFAIRSRIKQHVRQHTQ